MNGEAKQAFKDEVMAAVEKCLSGEYRSRDEALSALMNDIKALKAPEKMGGFGNHENMDLTDDQPVEEEEMQDEE